MEPQEEGMNIDPQIMVQTLQNLLAQKAVKEAQYEAAIQQLMAENQQLHTQIQDLSEVKAEPEKGDGAVVIDLPVADAIDVDPTEGDGVS